MADGLNQARAMRIAEIMADFRNLQNYIASIRAGPSAEEYNEDGFVLLRRCESDARTLLQQGFNVAAPGQRGDEEQQRMQLRRIIYDAAVKRHKAHKIYLRATAALRWINSRAAVLQGQRPHAGHVPALQQIRNTLRTVSLSARFLLRCADTEGAGQELAGVTDQRVELSLRSADTAAGKWIQEDPPLALVQSMLGS